jgi:tetratricopeptide (TPR) repeat protein
VSDANTALDTAIGQIEALTQAGKEEEALAAARALVDRDPSNPRAQFAYGGVLDAQGREAEAIAPYQRALELGLAGDDLPRLYVQYGSTLRNLGKAWDAAHLLEQGRAQFPAYAPIRVFHALALVSAGCADEAVVELLDVILAHTDGIALGGYDRALREYTDALRPRPR